MIVRHLVKQQTPCQTSVRHLVRHLVYELLQVNAPPPGSWEHAVDERDLTVEQWKELIYKVSFFP